MYFFDLEDGERAKGAAGVDLPSLSAAHDEAARYLSLKAGEPKDPGAG